MLGYFPDSPDATPELLRAVNALPTTRGYGGAPSGVSAGFDPLSAACTGAMLLAKLSGTTRLIVGTPSKLYEGSGGVMTDVSRAGSYTTGDVRWRMAQFGDTSLAINKATQLQYSNSGAFANVAQAPKAALMITVGAFTLLANIDDTGCGIGTTFGDQPNRWWCSPTFAATSPWVPATATQCASGLLVSAPGEITGLHRMGTNAVIFKRRAIYLGSYVGTPEVWRWDLVPGEVGIAGNEAAVSVGALLYFIGNDDIYSFDGSRPVSIGQGIKETFFASLNKDYAYRIEAQHDFQNQCIWWHYPKGQSTTLNAVLIYNYATKMWGEILLNVECTVASVVGQLTYDDLGDLALTYDDFPLIAYDSPFWQGGAPVMAYFSLAHEMFTLTGATTSFSVTTGYFGDDEMLQTCQRLRPRWGITPTAARMTPRTVMALGDTPTSWPQRAIFGDRFDVLICARWISFQVDCDGQVELQALTPTLKVAGHE